ncbi:MAG: DegV family protein [Oscillospiraceae bacterium]|jgi:DegV family protein with EDD domain|nr:DegV family protein [Oscillospiraceae bacterium]
MSFEIITDSSTGFSYKYVMKNNIRMISFKYYAGEGEYDTFTESHGEEWLAEFYERLRKKQSATTSCINADVFTSRFTGILNEGKDFIYLPLSSGLSVTYEIAADVCEKLKPLYPDRKMYVFDTRSAAQGQALTVDFAVRQRDEGKTIEEVYQWQVDNSMKICQWFTVDDLFFLKRGGRVSTTTAVAGTVLGIKPILHIDGDGKLIKMATARGRKASLDFLVDKFGEMAVSPEKQKVFIGHGDCADDLKYVQKSIKDKYGVKEFETGFINPVIGVHSGPGTVALFFYGTGR